jgi:UDP-N-acetyl-D-glucosamine dehydrogenase
MAYKPNVSDCRESPSLHLLRDLQTIEESGQFAIGFFDPYVAQVNSDKGLLNGFSSLKEALEWADCALVCVNHDVFDKSMILESGALVFDFCGMFRGKYGISGL